MPQLPVVPISYEFARKQDTLSLALNSKQTAVLSSFGRGHTVCSVGKEINCCWQRTPSHLVPSPLLLPPPRESSPPDAFSSRCPTNRSYGM